MKQLQLTDIVKVEL